ncbi:hypothetical protein C1H46_013250 [Malus baccata]|uniref:Uncharacterized protein n=1 Tax=Malus baccata TaxID=106549 RepID=A0A540MQQ7_MALBA|nr:hypothetical protein C1H46_019578 [Malus baccata]TQE01111.1 hypothetical protein C1H46_013250 [Malus baccata]
MEALVVLHSALHRRKRRHSQKDRSFIELELAKEETKLLAPNGSWITIASSDGRGLLCQVERGR